MTNKARQPKTERAVGDPTHCQPAVIIQKVDGGKGNTLKGEPVEPKPVPEQY